jgi:hypothetical protein
MGHVLQHKACITRWLWRQSRFCNGLTCRRGKVFPIVKIIGSHLCEKT